MYIYINVVVISSYKKIIIEQQKREKLWYRRAFVQLLVVGNLLPSGALKLVGWSP